MKKYKFSINHGGAKEIVAGEFYICRKTNFLMGDIKNLEGCMKGKAKKKVLKMQFEMDGETKKYDFKVSRRLLQEMTPETYLEVDKKENKENIVLCLFVKEKDIEREE